MDVSLESHERTESNISASANSAQGADVEADEHPEAREKEEEGEEEAEKEEVGEAEEEDTEEKLTREKDDGEGEEAAEQAHVASVDPETEQHGAPEGEPESEPVGTMKTEISEAGEIRPTLKPRVLRPLTSHPDAPAKKSNKLVADFDLRRVPVASPARSAHRVSWRGLAVHEQRQAESGPCQLRKPMRLKAQLLGATSVQILSRQGWLSSSRSSCAQSKGLWRRSCRARTLRKPRSRR